MSKTYTLSWKRPHTWRANGVCRCRFEPGSFYWFASWHFDFIEAFALLTTFDDFLFGDHSFRLTRCGKLIARQATYQGV